MGDGKKEDEKMVNNIQKDRLEKANAHFNRILPDLKAIARENTKKDKEKYFGGSHKGDKK
jgi:hypothetical protein